MCATDPDMTLAARERRTGHVAGMRHCSASASGRPLVLQEEADRLGRGVRATRIGVGATGTAAVPRVTTTVDDQTLRDGGPVAIAVHGAGVGTPAVAAHRDRGIV